MRFKTNFLITTFFFQVNMTIKINKTTCGEVLTINYYLHLFIVFNTVKI